MCEIDSLSLVYRSKVLRSSAVVSLLASWMMLTTRGRLLQVAKVRHTKKVT